MTAPHVLVVDDTEGNRYAVSRLLRGAGMRVSEAANGMEALRLIEGVPDLVVLDINLPDITGYDVCRRIKSQPESAFIPVMHLSASYTASADRAFGLEAGADAYLTHPLEPAVFLATARALLRAAHAESESRRAAREWGATFDAIRDPIFLVGFDGVVARCNRVAAELLGAERDVLVGRTWMDLVDAMDPGPGSTLRHITHRSVRDVETRIGGRWFSVSTSHAHGEQASDALVVCVMTDVTSRRAADQERELLLAQSERARADADAARADAETANRAKSDFLAVMSHELRTPLNAIGGFTDLIALGVRGPVTDEQTQDLDRIRRSQRTLITLINSLLSFAKLESGSLHYAVQDVDAMGALASAIETMESQFQAKSLRFSLEPCMASILVAADPDKLQQILLNLLSNAVKFTDAGGAITLSCTESDGRVRIQVRDTGRGIPADKIGRIFDPFMQVDQRLMREQQGVGLGLAISRDLARGMNGELSVNSILGEGAEFTLELPAASAAPTRRRAAPDAVTMVVERDGTGA
jgi:PAS domain S-box-containing protein